MSETRYCSGSGSCSCVFPGQCNLNCIGKDICKGSDVALTCYPGWPCAVSCDSKGEENACEDAVIDGSQASHLFVTCTDTQSCMNVKVMCPDNKGQCAVFCTGSGFNGNNCNGLRLSCRGSYCSIDCPDGINTCSNVRIQTSAATALFECIAPGISNNQCNAINSRTSPFIATTARPTPITSSPTNKPTFNPSLYPSSPPTNRPTPKPTPLPTTPTTSPSLRPTLRPSHFPTIRPTKRPSFGATLKPTIRPTLKPIFPTPTYRPTLKPTLRPTMRPSNNPSLSPTKRPTYNPTPSPIVSPSSSPTTPQPTRPTGSPSMSPTPSPTYPTHSPTINYYVVDNAPEPTPSFVMDTGEVSHTDRMLGILSQNWIYAASAAGATLCCFVIICCRFHSKKKKKENVIAMPADQPGRKKSTKGDKIDYVHVKSSSRLKFHEVDKSQASRSNDNFDVEQNVLINNQAVNEQQEVINAVQPPPPSDPIPEDILRKYSGLNQKRTLSKQLKTRSFTIDEEITMEEGAANHCPVERVNDGNIPVIALPDTDYNPSMFETDQVQPAFGNVADMSQMTVCHDEDSADTQDTQTDDSDTEQFDQEIDDVNDLEDVLMPIDDNQTDIDDVFSSCHDRKSSQTSLGQFTIPEMELDVMQ